MSKPRFPKDDKCYACFADKSHHLEYHHIKPSFLGRDNKRDNIVTLCRECHDYIEDLYISYYKTFVPEYKWWKDQDSVYNKTLNSGSNQKRQIEERSKATLFKECFESRIKSIDFRQLMESCVVMIRLAKNVSTAEVKPKSKLREFLTNIFSL